MCGIAGIHHFDPHALVDRQILERMTNMLAHRGPDGIGYYLDGNIGFGHRRLKIIDLTEAGHQPMRNEDGTIWITYNGECYNYRDFWRVLTSKGHRLISRTDTEVLLHLYEEYGLDFLSKIEGMYAFGLWDTKRQRLLLVRDRIGIKPLFYYVDSKHISFASELKALRIDPSIPRDLDYAGLSHFLHLMSIPDPLTIFKGVKKLLPGHYLLIENGKVALHQYWDVCLPPVDSTTNVEFDHLCKDFEEHFKQSVTSHLVADVPVGAFLSGGVDSGSIAVVASRAVQAPLKTFSFTFKGLGEYDESRYAFEVASRCKTEHHEFNIIPDLVKSLPMIAWQCDEPFAVSSSFALYFLARNAREHVKVVLTGDGGDEIFAGYPGRHGQGVNGVDYFPVAMRRLLKAILSILFSLDRSKTFKRGIYQRAKDVLRRSSLVPGERYVDTFCCYKNYQLAQLIMPEAWEVINEGWNDNLIQRYYESFDNVGTLERNLYSDMKSMLVSEMLTKVDRMTMAFGLEARVPFLDHKLIEWSFRIPGEYKLHDHEGKLLVKKVMEKYLPPYLLYRPKHGFNLPMKIWLKDDLWEFVRDTLSEDKIRKRGLFRPTAVTALLKTHANTRHDLSNQILVLVMLELWFQQFMDGRQLWDEGANFS